MKDFSTSNLVVALIFGIIVSLIFSWGMMQYDDNDQKEFEEQKRALIENNSYKNRGSF